MAYRQLWPEADQYRIRDMEYLFRPHPEGLPSTLRNCFVVGCAGVGKTMVLKKMCYDLAQTDNMLPIYIKIEPWVGKISGELAYPLSERKQPRENELEICIRILIALGLIRRMIKYASKNVVESAVKQFPAVSEFDINIEGWLVRQVEMLKKVVEQRDKLPQEYLSFPLLSDFANSVGEYAKNENQTLVFLFDQVDKTTKPIFKAISTLLRRGEYIAVIATRPCPCAPEEVIMPPQVVIGNDYTVHWLGSNPRSDAWRKFISEIVDNSDLDEEVKEIVNVNIKSITSTLGPSTRWVIELCGGIQRRINLGSNPTEALQVTLEQLFDTKEAVHTELISKFSANPRNIVDRFKNRSLANRKKQGLGPGPAGIQIKGGELFGEPRIQEFLRWCTREGVLLPISTKHGLDVPMNEYELNPVLVAPRDYGAFKDFDENRVFFNVRLDELSKWIAKQSGGWQKGSDQKKKVFVPYWMTDHTNEDTLPTILRKRILGRAEIVTGDIEEGSPLYANKIKESIGDSDVVIIDTTVPRRDIYVEFGWAIGHYKPVLLTAKNNESIKNNLNWVKDRHIHSYGEESLIEEFMSKIMHSLDTHYDRIACWKDDVFNEPLNLYKPQAQEVVIIGGGEHWKELIELAKSVCHENKFLLKDIYLKNLLEKEGDVLTKVIVLARSAGTLILSYNGNTDNDTLCSVAGGIFNSTAKVRSLYKSLILYDDSGLSSDEDIFPSLLTRQGHVQKFTTFQAAINKLRRDITRIKDHLNKSKSRTAKKRRK